jgi:hypothetical protein
MWVLHCTVEPTEGVCSSGNQVWIEMAVQANPLALGVEGAVDIGVAVMLILAVGWAYAMLARVINETSWEPRE